MEGQIQVINGKPRRTFLKNGIEYTRVGFDLPVSEFEKFEKKANELTETMSNVWRKLIMGFNRSFGTCDPQVKDPGCLFDRSLNRQVKEAVFRAVDEIMPESNIWQSRN